MTFCARSSPRSTFDVVSLALFALAGIWSVAPAQAAEPTVRLRGTIASATGHAFTVTTAAGPVTIVLGKNAIVLGVVPANLDAIEPGAFVGITNIQEGAGRWRSLEVHVFPPGMRGTGDGDRLQERSTSNGGVSAMTNGTVARPRTQAMTNGTVSRSSSGAATRVVSIRYRSGTKLIDIPPSTIVVRIVPATAALLEPGAHVVVVAIPAVAGKPELATRVFVGEHGTVPPM